MPALINALRQFSNTLHYVGKDLAVASTTTTSTYADMSDYEGQVWASFSYYGTGAAHTITVTYETSDDSTGSGTNTTVGSALATKTPNGTASNGETIVTAIDTAALKKYLRVKIVTDGTATPHWWCFVNIIGIKQYVN